MSLQQQLMEYIIQDIIEMLTVQQEMEYDEAMNKFYNSEVFEKLCLAKRFPTAGHLPCSRQPSSLESLGFRQLSIPWVLPLPPHLPL